MQKHKFNVRCPNAFFVASVPIQLKQGYSASMLHAPNAPDAKTYVPRNVSHCALYRIHTCPTRACKIVHRRFVPQTHRNALRDPHVLPDAKT
jgi:hypothetical protein